MGGSWQTKLHLFPCRAQTISVIYSGSEFEPLGHTMHPLKAVRCKSTCAFQLIPPLLGLTWFHTDSCPRCPLFVKLLVRTSLVRILYSCKICNWLLFPLLYFSDWYSCFTLPCWRFCIYTTMILQQLFEWTGFHLSTIIYRWKVICLPKCSVWVFEQVQSLWSWEEAHRWFILCVARWQRPGQRTA